MKFIKQYFLAAPGALPERIAGMILRGIWLANKEAMSDYLGKETHKYFPEVFERFISYVPPSARKNPAEYYYSMMTTAHHKKNRDEFTYGWAYYENSIETLKELSPEEKDREIKNSPYQSLSILEAHYIVNKCFLEEDYIIRNAGKIPHVPITIVQGRYDVACPPVQAWRLHKALPWSKLYFVFAGHSRFEPEIRKKLISETDKMYYQIRV